MQFKDEHNLSALLVKDLAGVLLPEAKTSEKAVKIVDAFLRKNAYRLVFQADVLFAAWRRGLLITDQQADQVVEGLIAAWHHDAYSSGTPQGWGLLIEQRLTELLKTSPALDLNTKDLSGFLDMLDGHVYPGKFFVWWKDKKDDLEFREFDLITTALSFAGDMVGNDDSHATVAITVECYDSYGIAECYWEHEKPRLRRGLKEFSWAFSKVQKAGYYPKLPKQFRRDFSY